MALPLINLDDKTFEELVKEAKKRIPIYAPQWTDHNLHDPGITLIELFAWLTEMQIYRLNRVTKENQWKFLKLMGIEKEDVKKEDEAKILEEAILQAQRDLKTAYRAVTSTDYEYLLFNPPESNKIEVPEIARAKAIPRYHPIQHQEVPGIVTVVVVPQNSNLDPTQETNLLKSVYQYLDQYRLLTTELFVFFPPYVKAAVDAEVAVKPQYLENTVIENVKARLREFLDPVCGGPEKTGWPFGRPVYLSEVYQVIDGVEGVDYVKDVKIKVITGEGQVNELTGDIIIPKHGLLKSVAAEEHTITLYYEDKNKQEKEDLND